MIDYGYMVLLLFSIKKRCAKLLTHKSKYLKKINNQNLFSGYNP